MENSQNLLNRAHPRLVAVRKLLLVSDIDDIDQRSFSYSRQSRTQTQTEKPYL